MTDLLLPAAIVASFAIIVWLWQGDPKRRRVAGLPATAQAAAKRRLLAIGALLPGVVLALLGDSAAFLLWLGSCAMGGWLVAQFRYRGDPE
jgi:hypothetical protein